MCWGNNDSRCSRLKLEQLDQAEGNTPSHQAATAAGPSTPASSPTPAVARGPDGPAAEHPTEAAPEVARPPAAPEADPAADAATASSTASVDCLLYTSDAADDM
eukprot:15472812-Alexandrium_andersonii.AAC.1